MSLRPGWGVRPFPVGYLCEWASKRRPFFPLAGRLCGSQHQSQQTGCLLSYGPNQHASHARAAHFVDRIIKGMNPADLPVELPGVVELAVNRKTAKALDIKIPNSRPSF